MKFLATLFLIRFISMLPLSCVNEKSAGYLYYIRKLSICHLFSFIRGRSQRPIVGFERMLRTELPRIYLILRRRSSQEKSSFSLHSLSSTPSFPYSYNWLVTTMGRYWCQLGVCFYFVISHFSTGPGTIRNRGWGIGREID